MQKLSIFFSTIRQGIKSLLRNRMFTLASVGTVTACLFLFGLFYFVMGNIEHIMAAAEENVTISVYFNPGISDERLQIIQNNIKMIEGVKKVEYISAQKAWENFKQENFAEDKELIESFGEDNPLSDSASFEVYTTTIDIQSEVVKKIQMQQGVRSVKRPNELAGNISKINTVVYVASSILIIVLVLVSIFLIHSTIATGITVRRPEIALMRLMGATDYVIWTPFVVEGIIIGMIGAAVPLLILVFIYAPTVDYISSKISLFTGKMSFMSAYDVFAFLVPVAFLIGIGIGLVGSFITVRKHMKI